MGLGQTAARQIAPAPQRDLNLISSKIPGLHVVSDLRTNLMLDEQTKFVLVDDGIPVSGYSHMAFQAAENRSSERPHLEVLSVR